MLGLLEFMGVPGVAGLLELLSPETGTSDSAGLLSTSSLFDLLTCSDLVPFSSELNAVLS